MNSSILKLIIILNTIYYGVFGGAAAASKEKIILANYLQLDVCVIGRN